MKRTKLKLCSVVLVVTMLMSMLAILPTSAVDSKAQPKDNLTEIKTVEDEHGLHYYGPTGNNLTQEAETPEDAEVIESLSEYNKIAKNTTQNGSDKYIRKAEKLPESVDNSKSIYFPEIGDQGNLGSCLFWAQIYYQYTYEYNRMTKTPTTPENAFSPQWSYNVATAGADMQCTTAISLNFMKYQGSVPMSQVPYDENYLNAYPTEEIWRNSINYRLKEYQFFEQVGVDETLITSPDDSDLEPIKAALNNGEILSYSTMMYGWTHTELITDSMAPENYDHVGEVAVTSMDSQEGGHRMTIVGYNDNIWIDINKNYKVDDGEMGAFKIANSWGTEYGNDGFAWVAYDALNYISCVKGVEINSERDRIFTEITRFELMPYGEDTDLYLKYTLNTADRTSAIVSVTAEKDCTVKTASAMSNMNYGDILAYDGSTEETDATMIMPLQSAFPEVTSENFAEYTWTVQFRDNFNDSYTLTVKDAQIIDEASGKTYEVKDSFPLSLNGNSKTLKYHESDLNHAVIYYRGFYTPSISYKLDQSGAQWVRNVELTESLEKYGYTHKFVLDLEDSDKATVYFSDADGKVDDNGSKMFTATEGLNTYITENMGKPLSVSMTNDLSTHGMDGVADVGRFGLFTVEADGGYAPYMYEFIFTNLTTGEVTTEEYTDWHIKGFYFTQAGDYEVVVNFKDSAGTIVSDVNYVTITHFPFEFTTFEATGTNNTLVNTQPITFTAVTNFENIGIHYQVYNEYDLVIEHNGSICYSTTIPMKYKLTNSEYMTSTIINEWTPTQAGNYTATISATDCAGEYAEKTISFTVNDCIIGDTDGDGKITIVDTTFLQMYLARTFGKDRLRMVTADTDKDSKLSINDATYIQRYLASYNKAGYVGEIVI